MRQILLVLVLFALMGTASVGTQIKTAKYYRGQDQAVVATSIMSDFTGNAVSTAKNPGRADIFINNVNYSSLKDGNYFTNSLESLILQATANVHVDIQYGRLGLV